MRDRPWNIVYQCVHVRKEEGRGGSREKEKGTESRHGGARVWRSEKASCG